MNSYIHEYIEWAGGGGSVVPTFDQLASAHHMRMRMIDSHIKTERLQQYILIEDKLLGEICIALFGSLRQALVRRSYHMLQLTGLLLHFGCQKQTGRGHGIAMEMCERVERIESMHIHDGRIDAQL